MREAQPDLEAHLRELKQQVRDERHRALPVVYSKGYTKLDGQHRGNVKPFYARQVEKIIRGEGA